MDFIPGNDFSEWQILGDKGRSVYYQQVTVHEPMGWSGLSLECYKEACAKFSGMLFAHWILYFIGPIALKWNSDETLPMNCDIALTTDILIYDSCGKKVGSGNSVFTVDCSNSRKGMAVHSCNYNGLDFYSQIIYPLRRWPFCDFLQPRWDFVH